MEATGLDGGHAELKEESGIRGSAEAFGRGKYTLCYGYWCSRAGRGRCWAEKNAGYSFGSSVWSYLSDKVFNKFIVACYPITSPNIALCGRSSKAAI